MRNIIVIFLVLFGLSVSAQENIHSNRILQVSGIITDADSSNVVPYVTISNSNSKLAYAANYKGYYSFVAKAGDTLTFSAVGYRSQKAVIPQNHPDDKYTLMIELIPDIIMIKSVRIYPWATVEEFTHSFMNMKIADDDLEIARKNLSPEGIRVKMNTLPLDSREIARMNNMYEHNRTLNRNMVQTNPLLNPFAWGRFIQAITSGDKSRGN